MSYFGDVRITCNDEGTGQYLARVSQQIPNGYPGDRDGPTYELRGMGLAASEKEAVAAAIMQWMGAWK